MAAKGKRVQIYIPADLTEQWDRLPRYERSAEVAKALRAWWQKEGQEHNMNVVLRARMTIIEAILMDIRDKIEGENKPGEWTAYVYEQAGIALNEAKK